METEDLGEQFEEWRQGAMGLYQAGMLADASEAQLVVVQLAEQLYGQESRELAHKFGFLGLIYANARQLRLLRDGGSPNLGRTVGSKRVIAETWVPDKVRTISPTV